MIGMRKFVGFVMAFAFVAFALSANAADKTYSLTMSPVTGTSPTAMTALFTNKGNSSFNSLQLTVPPGYTLGATPTASRGQVSVSGQVISVLNINLPTGSGQTMSVTMPVVTTSATCSSSGVTGNWTAVLWTGSTLSGNNFGLVGPPTSTTSTTIGAQCYTVSGNTVAGGTVTCTPSPVAKGGSSLCTAAVNANYTLTGFSANCGAPTTATSCTVGNVQSNQTVTANYIANTLAITSVPPTSAAVGIPFDVTIASTPAGAAVSFSAGCNATATNTPDPNKFTITVNSVPAPPLPNTCTITFSATNYNPIYLTSLKVYAGAVDCGPLNPAVAPPAGATFNASLVCSAASIINPGYAAGFRGPNKSGTCQLVNATLTNNICAAVNQIDANGNTIPPKAVSFVWDIGYQPQAAFTYTLTWTSEFVNPATGLPFPSETKYCTGTGATACATRAVLKACTSTNVAFASIPAGEPACIAEEGWTTVPVADCANATNPNFPNPPPAACIRMSTTIIDAKDPPIIRDL